MTETLERHSGGPIGRRTLFGLTKGRRYVRRSLLVLEYSGRPVEMGTFRINIKALTPDLRAQVLRSDTPLGRLRIGRTNFRSSPRVFLKIAPNSEWMGMFRMRESRTLYGRQTEITSNGRKIVEILPPMDA